MNITRAQRLIAAALCVRMAMTTTMALAADSLPSWNDGAGQEVCR